MTKNYIKIILVIPKKTPKCWQASQYVYWVTFINKHATLALERCEHASKEASITNRIRVVDLKKEFRE